MLFSAIALRVLEFCCDTGVTCILLYLTHSVDLELVPGIKEGGGGGAWTGSGEGLGGGDGKKSAICGGVEKDRQDETCREREDDYLEGEG